MDQEFDTEKHRQPSHNQDFVIRQGFPALRQADGQPWLQGDEPLPPKGAPVRIFSNVLLPSKATHLDATTTATTDDKSSNDNKDIKNHNESSIWQSLYHDCRTVFTVRTREDDQAYSAGVTYFVPAAMPPRCALEALVQSIFQAHTACLPPSSIILEQSGAEWWTLVLDNDKDEAKQEQENSNGQRKAVAAGAPLNDIEQTTNDRNNRGQDDDDEEEEPSDEVGLHFDADYGLEEQVTNLFLHPRIATVTYLTSVGAPTVVLDRQSPQPQGNLLALNGPIHQAWLCHPVQGRHLAFDGRLLHGAPATFFPPRDPENTNNHKNQPHHDDVDDDGSDSKPPPTKRPKLDDHESISVNQRITLLVNVWVNHCPMDAEPLDEDICAQLQTPMDSLTLATLDDSNMISVEKVVQLKASPNDPAGEEEVVIGDRIVTAYYNPTMDELHAAAKSALTVKIEFEEGAVSLLVGGMAPVEQEDGDENEDSEP